MRSRVGAGLSFAAALLALPAGCALSAPAADETLAAAACSPDEHAARAMAAARASPDDASAQLDAAVGLFLAADQRLQQATVRWLDAHPDADLRAVLDAGDQLDDDVRRAVVSLCTDGLAFAERARELAPGLAGVDLQVGLHTSFLAWANGPAHALFAGHGPRLVAAITAAVAADPGLDGAGPLRLEGRFRGRAPWPYGDRPAARAALEQAVDLAPITINHLFLGDVLAELGEHEAARTAWQAALAAPPDATTRWTGEALREQARRRLAARR